MLVSAFMVPLDKVATCSPADSVQTALDTLIAKKIGAVVVLHQSNYHMPVGIVTKTDFVQAYQKGIPLTGKMGDIMSKNLTTVRDTMGKDEAAKIFEHAKIHHAVVLGQHGEFKGLISSWDLVAECARDARAWPWNRTSDGKFHKPNEVPVAPLSPTAKEVPVAPLSPTAVQETGERRHSYLDIVDSLRYVTDT